MPRVDRHKLLFGPYRTPRFKYGQNVLCEARGEVTIWKLSDGRTPWPMGKTKRAVSLVLYKDLARAVRHEAACAVAYWWGVGASAVNKWRRALGVPVMSEGDRRLKREHSQQPWFKAAQRKAWSKARDPVRRAKIAAAKRGRPRPKHVIEAMNKARLAKPVSATSRRRMSAANKRRGTRPPWLNPPWSPSEDKMVLLLAPSEAARRTGRTLSAVYSRRWVLGATKAKRDSILPRKSRTRPAATGCRTPGLHSTSGI